MVEFSGSSGAWFMAHPRQCSFTSQDEEGERESMMAKNSFPYKQKCFVMLIKLYVENVIWFFFCIFSLTRAAARMRKDTPQTIKPEFIEWYDKHCMWVLKIGIFWWLFQKTQERMLRLMKWCMVLLVRFRWNKRMFQFLRRKEIYASVDWIGAPSKHHACLGNHTSG